MFLLLLLDADCSGRTLATLLVAWVAAAMIASILLRWEYMWIVLTMLTLLFLLVCGYVAYNAKRAYTRALLDERTRSAATGGDGEIWTVSGMSSAGNHGQTDSSGYTTHLITDLPPSYASVVLMQTTSASPQVSLAVGGASDEVKFEEPPPYATVIVPDTPHDRSAEVPNGTNALLPSVMVASKKIDVEAAPATRDG